MYKKPLFAVFCFMGVIVAGSLVAATPQAKPYHPKIDPASDQWKEAQKRIQVPAGFKVDLWAAEPLLANPVCFAIDHKNRFYVAETFRLHAGVTDIRSHTDWLNDDLACRTVEDRIAMLKRKLGARVKSYGVEHDRIQRIEDTIGSGKANKSVVWADGFHNIEDGIGAGVVTRNGDVWYTCIPNLWNSSPHDRQGQSRSVQNLAHRLRRSHQLSRPRSARFAVRSRRQALLQHRRPRHQREGRGEAVVPSRHGFRDALQSRRQRVGSLCLWAAQPAGIGLRRVRQSVHGGQQLRRRRQGALRLRRRGRRQRLAHRLSVGHGHRRARTLDGGKDGRPAMGRTGGVPRPAGRQSGQRSVRSDILSRSGFARALQQTLFLVRFPRLQRRQRRPLLRLQAERSDVQDGRSASIHLVGAWDRRGFRHGLRHLCVRLGRRLGEAEQRPHLEDYVSELAKQPDVLEVQKIMAEGFKNRSTADLISLLQNKDMRVRQSAQFALADKGSESIPAFTGVARENKDRLARFHAIWGLGQIGRKDATAYKPLLPLLKDADSEVRAQAAKTLGDGRVAAAAGTFIALLKDPEPRVRFFAAQGLARLGDKKAVTAVLDMLRDNADKDAYLRHAGVMVLSHSGAKDVWMTAADDPSPAVRMGVLLALRRTNDADVARYLNDADPKLVVEAARAINDVPIDAALPKLAALVHRPGLSLPLGYRVLNANFRLGTKENAEAVAAFAGRADANDVLRIEALKELADWTKPAGRDRVMGVWRPLQPRSPEIAADAFRAALGSIFTGSNKVRNEAVATAVKLGVKEVGPVLLETVNDVKRPARTRAEALRALGALKDPHLDVAVKSALNDAEPLVRSEARRVLARTHPAEALPLLAKTVESGAVIERQGAYTALGEMKAPAVNDLLAKQLDKLLAKKQPPEVALDLLEAAGKHHAKEITQRLQRYEAARPKGDELAPYREALFGGDAENGRRIFFYKSEVSCLRCHKVNGEGGEVGPEMKGIGSRQKREYLLESIVDPNKVIAKGYESVLLVLNNGQTRTGVLKGEDAKTIRIMTADGKLITVAKADVDERHPGKSAMPDDVIKKLSKSELRDVIEFLAGLKEKM